MPVQVQNPALCCHDKCVVYFLSFEVFASSLSGIEQDAVNTFTKYISPDAAKPIPITEAMRNDIIGKQHRKLWENKARPDLFGHWLRDFLRT